MERMNLRVGMTVAAALAALMAMAAGPGEERSSLRVPGGLAFAEFKGYEGWQVISLSENGGKVAVILGNTPMIKAFQSGVPDNGQPFPDGAKMAKIHWSPKKNESAPGQPTVAGELHDIDFMVKDHQRFADSGGWGYAAFKYDAAAARYTPQTLSDQPPQANDAKCGAACHTAARQRDYVFTAYAAR